MFSLLNSPKIQRIRMPDIFITLQFLLNAVISQTRHTSVSFETAAISALTKHTSNNDEMLQ